MSLIRLKHHLQRTRTSIDDYIRASDLVCDVIARASLALHKASDLSTPSRHALPRGLEYALRFARRTGTRSAVKRSFSEWLARAQSPPPMRTRRRPQDPVALASALIVKAPHPGEKGVLFVGNQGDLRKLSESGSLAEVQEEFLIFGLSAWAPPSPRTFATIVRACREPVHIGMSNLAEAEAYCSYAPLIRPLPFMCCDWLNPADFSPKPIAERSIDIIMVAGWGAYKRHWLLFSAMRSLPRSLRVVLVGGWSAGRSAHDIMNEAIQWGVKQNLECYENLPVEDVNAMQADARVALQFSGREGCCVAVTEAMMANTPVGVTADSRFGSKLHVNASTGMLLDRERLSSSIEKLLDRAERFAPRDWLIENACCHTSSARLNEQLREITSRSGACWTHDITPVFRRRQQMHYVDESQYAAFAPHAVRLSEIGVLVRPVGGRDQH